MSGAARRSPLDPASASPSPLSNGGDFLLQLLRRPPRSSPSTPSLPLDDPAVAAVGPSHSFSPPDPTAFSPPRQLPPWVFTPAHRHPNPPSRYSPPGFGHPTSALAAPRAPHPPDLTQFPQPRDHHIPQRNGDARRGPSKEPPPARPAVLQFGSFHMGTNLEASSGVRENGGFSETRRFPGNLRAGNFTREDCAGSRLDAEFGRDGKEYNREREDNCSVASHYSKSGTLRVDNVVEELDFDVDVKGLAEGLLSDDDEEETMFGAEVGGSRSSLEVKHATHSKAVNEGDLLIEQVAESLILKEEHVEHNGLRKIHGSRGKDRRFDTSRGHNVSSQRVRYRRAAVPCRHDINSLSPYFLYIYKSLIPEEEEKAKQRQLLLSLEKLVNKEWPNASLHLYGSCANSFGVSKSDIDICLAIDDSETSKSDILLKLADILQSDNLQNVQANNLQFSSRSVAIHASWRQSIHQTANSLQFSSRSVAIHASWRQSIHQTALTHARVPIVKLMDPVSGISCDICVNNLLAVVNTKLLRDYAQIDERLRQLAFLVKHWAKSRGVNETYQGTLSSYAYVLMCIHFLQSRRPAILPCLQEMGATYAVTVEGVKCVFFDQVEKLHGFGSRNKESIAKLLWAFFKYWAYCHDYANDVISIRVGSIISKHSKDWTRRVGNDRHLICIEDPFETSHDLGRVVDKFSIKILREEFERAADILQFDPNPSVTLFEPYVRESHPS